MAMSQEEFAILRNDVRAIVADAVTVQQYTVKDQDIERQAIEDNRSIHRNLNRFLTLIVALVLGLVITYSLTNKGIPWLGIHLPSSWVKLAPYSFVITIMLDSSLAAYAYVKRY
jgi:hypothetical protein